MKRTRLCASSLSLQPFAAFLVAVCAASLVASPANAAIKCKASFDKKTGAVVVKVAGFVGTPKWRVTQDGTGRPFANESDCVGGTVAKSCTLDPAHPDKAPASCIVHVIDDQPQTCQARIKGCVSGVRSLPTSGISVVRAGERRHLVSWGLRALLRVPARLRTFDDALSMRGRLRGNFATNPADSSGIHKGLFDWRLLNIYQLRAVAERLRRTLRADSSLASTITGLWPIGDFWWSSSSNAQGSSSSRWGVRRTGSGSYSLRLRGRARTGGTLLRSRFGDANLRASPLLRGLDGVYCCKYQESESCWAYCMNDELRP